MKIIFHTNQILKTLSLTFVFVPKFPIIRETSLPPTINLQKGILLSHINTILSKRYHEDMNPIKTTHRYTI